MLWLAALQRQRQLLSQHHWLNYCTNGPITIMETCSTSKQNGGLCPWLWVVSTVRPVSGSGSMWPAGMIQIYICSVKQGHHLNQAWSRQTTFIFQEIEEVNPGKPRLVCIQVLFLGLGLPSGQIHNSNYTFTILHPDIIVKGHEFLGDYKTCYTCHVKASSHIIITITQVEHTQTMWR